MTLLRVRPTTTTQDSAQTQRRFRPELQGLRAVAALLVVVYHVWLDRVSGGVDVFFLISGFLITGQLFRASLRGGIEFRPMWGRMIKRLFPAALTVLTVTMVAAIVLMPEYRWFQTIREIIASALYFENWQLAADSVDYFAQHGQASVVQHFWSLSIQGQFYLVWPLLVTLVALVARRAGWSLRKSLFTALTVVTAGSLAYSVWLTAVNQPLAYFVSPTRIWEFGLGGLLALTIDRIVLPRGLRIVLGWVGVLGLVSCGLILQVGTMFPGYVALWPMGAAALVLLAGATESRVGADRFLSTRPLAYLGNLSYSLYLWHWPVLVFVVIVRNGNPIGPLSGTAIIAFSLLLSVLTYHFVENPVRESQIGVVTRWGAYRFGVVVLIPVLVAAGIWQVVSVRRASFALDLDDPDHPGAQILDVGGPILDTDTSVVPPFAALSKQWAGFSKEQCRESDLYEELRICSTNMAGEPGLKLVLTGDSHAMQHIAALRPIVKKHNWQLISMGRGGCPLTAEPILGDEEKQEECKRWNAAVMEEIIELKPDAVLTMGTRDVRAGLKERTPEGYVAQWRKLDEAGIPVVAFRDNPRFDFDPVECVQQNDIDALRCRVPRDDFLAPEPPYAEMDIPSNVSFVDVSDAYCTEDFCPPVIGNVLVYMDNNHVTSSYMETMSPLMEEKLLDVLGWEDNPAAELAPPR